MCSVCKQKWFVYSMTAHNTVCWFGSVSKTLRLNSSVLPEGHGSTSTVRKVFFNIFFYMLLAVLGPYRGSVLGAVLVKQQLN